jgi:hypothetical protein
MTRIGALVVHGMGRGAGYSESSHRAPRSARRAGVAHQWKEVLWAPILDPRESDLWTAITP